MSGLKLFNVSDRDFEYNGIILGINNFDIILGKLKLDWEDNIEDKVENMVPQVKNIEYDSNEVDDDPPIASFVIILK